MFMADLRYIFIYIIKWFLKSPVCFRSHTKYENNFNWNMHTVEQIWRKRYFGIFEKETSKSNMTVSNNSILGIAFEHETTGNMHCIQHVHTFLYPNTSYIRLIRYVSNPDITMWLQSQASLSSHVYTFNACMRNNQSSGCRSRPKCSYNQSEFVFFPRSSFSWLIITVTAEYSIAVADP